MALSTDHTSTAPQPQDLHQRIKTLIADTPVTLFMKGNRDFPMCGFSAQLIRILDHLGVDYREHDVLKDADLRQGIKSFSDWPTIPQLYVRGEFVGGCDIVSEMFKEGELRRFLIDHQALSPDHADT